MRYTLLFTTLLLFSSTISGTASGLDTSNLETYIDKYYEDFNRYLSRMKEIPECKKVSPSSGYALQGVCITDIHYDKPSRILQVLISIEPNNPLFELAMSLDSDTERKRALQSIANQIAIWLGLKPFTSPDGTFQNGIIQNTHLKPNGYDVEVIKKYLANNANFAIEINAVSKTYSILRTDGDEYVIKEYPRL